MYASIVRTVVPVIVGILVAQAARVGLDLPESAVTEIVTVVVTAVYYAASRFVEEYVSPLTGRLLLSAGLSGERPEYRKAA